MGGSTTGILEYRLDIKVITNLYAFSAFAEGPLVAKNYGREQKSLEKSFSARVRKMRGDAISSARSKKDLFLLCKLRLSKSPFQY